MRQARTGQSRLWPYTGQYGPTGLDPVPVPDQSDPPRNNWPNHRPDTGTPHRKRVCFTATVTCFQTHLPRCVTANFGSLPRSKRGPLRLLLQRGRPVGFEHTHDRLCGNTAKRIPLSSHPPDRNRRRIMASLCSRPDQKNPYVTSHSVALCAVCNSLFGFEEIIFSSGGLTKVMLAKFRVALNLLPLTLC